MGVGFVQRRERRAGRARPCERLSDTDARPALDASMAMLPMPDGLTSSYAEERAVMSPSVSRSVDHLDGLYMT